VSLHAQALTYTTVLSLIPLAAVALAIFKGFGGTEGMVDRMMDWALHNISGSPEQQESLAQYVEEFVAKIDTGQISWISILILVWSVLMLLNHIEGSVNAIFGINTLRPFVTRILTYWAVLTFGPLLLAGSFAVTATLQNSSVAGTVSELGDVWKIFLKVMPLLATWVAFTTMYLVIPAARVKFSSAFMAAVITGSVWNLFKYAYAWYAARAVTQQVIFGSLAVIPLFVVWLYVSWVLILFGAQLTYAFQNSETYRKEDERTVAGDSYMERAACRLFLEVARAFHHGRTPPTPEVLVAKLQIPRRLLEGLLQRLSQARLLHPTEPDGGLVPGRDLGEVTVHTIVQELRDDEGPDPSLIMDADRDTLDRLLDQADKERLRVTGNVTFRELAASDVLGGADQEATAPAE